MQAETLSRGDQTRAVIIQAAHDLFLRQGYHGTSMRQIAKNAGLALGGLYNHFQGKEDIFHAVFIKYHPYQTVIPSLMHAQGETIEELVRDSARRFLDSLKKHPDFLNLMFIEIVEFNNIHVGELFSRVYQDGLQIVDRIVQSDPQRLKDIPPFILMRTFMGLFFSYYISEIMLAQEAPQDFHINAMDHLIDIFLHGILKPSTGEQAAGS
jgi:AcrR family transcriptional regulator